MLETIEINANYFDELTGCIIMITEVIPGGLVRAKAIKVPLGQRGRNKRFIGDKLVTPAGFIREVTEADWATFKGKVKVPAKKKVAVKKTAGKKVTKKAKGRSKKS